MLSKIASTGVCNCSRRDSDKVASDLSPRASSSFNNLTKSVFVIAESSLAALILSLILRSIGQPVLSPTDTLGEL